MKDLDYPEYDQVFNLRNFIRELNLVGMLASMLVGMLLIQVLYISGIFVIPPGHEVPEAEEVKDLEYYIDYFSEMTLENYQNNIRSNQRMYYNYTVDVNSEFDSEIYRIDINQSRFELYRGYAQGYLSVVDSINSSYYVFNILTLLAFDVLPNFGSFRHFSVYEYSSSFELYIIEDYHHGDVFYLKYDYFGFLQEFEFFNIDGYVRSVLL